MVCCDDGLFEERMVAVELLRLYLVLVVVVSH